jgi:hypothetical protein
MLLLSRCGAAVVITLSPTFKPARPRHQTVHDIHRLKWLLHKPMAARGHTPSSPVPPPSCASCEVHGPDKARQLCETMSLDELAGQSHL